MIMKSLMYLIKSNLYLQVSLLSCQDQLVSHLSAKCMSVYIINELCIAVSISVKH